MRGILIASVEEIVCVVIVQNAKFILGADAAVQRLAVLPKLNVGQPSRNATIAVGVKGINVDGSPDITAGVDRQWIGDFYTLAVDHAGLFLTGGVDEIAVCIGRILRTIHIAVAQGQLQVSGAASARTIHGGIVMDDLRPGMAFLCRLRLAHGAAKSEERRGIGVTFRIAVTQWLVIGIQNGSAGTMFFVVLPYAVATLSTVAAAEFHTAVILLCVSDRQPVRTCARRKLAPRLICFQKNIGS